MKRLPSVFAAVLSLAALGASLAPASASANDRVALVIGNNAYPADGNFDSLKNCRRDATLIEASLKRAGFQVTVLKDADYHAIDAGVSAFEKAIPKGGTAVFYFAGHGIEFEGKNYLMGSNAKLESRSRLGQEGFDAEVVAKAMLVAGAKSSFLFLDCCREAPKSVQWLTRGIKKRGLAEIDVDGDIVICYSAKPGQAAFDAPTVKPAATAASEDEDELEYSPYAQSLARWMHAGLDHLNMLQKVRSDVHVLTGGSQRTWENGSFLEPFFFAKDSTETVAAVVAPVAPAVPAQPEPAPVEEPKTAAAMVPTSTIPAPVPAAPVEAASVTPQPVQPTPSVAQAETQAPSVSAEPSSQAATGSMVLASATTTTTTTAPASSAQPLVAVPVPREELQAAPASSQRGAAASLNEGSPGDTILVDIGGGAQLSLGYMAGIGGNHSWLGDSDVTAAQWLAVMEDGRVSPTQGSAVLIGVGRQDAQTYVDRLNLRVPLPEGWRWSLPAAVADTTGNGSRINTSTPFRESGFEFESETGGRFPGGSGAGFRGEGQRFESGRGGEFFDGGRGIRQSGRTQGQRSVGQRVPGHFQDFRGGGNGGGRGNGSGNGNGSGGGRGNGNGGGGSFEPQNGGGRGGFPGHRHEEGRGGNGNSGHRHEEGRGGNGNSGHRHEHGRGEVFPQGGRPQMQEGRFFEDGATFREIEVEREIPSVRQETTQTGFRIAIVRGR